MSERTATESSSSGSGPSTSISSGYEGEGEGEGGVDEFLRNLVASTGAEWQQQQQQQQPKEQEEEEEGVGAGTGSAAALDSSVRVLSGVPYKSGIAPPSDSDPFDASGQFLDLFFPACHYGCHPVVGGAAAEAGAADKGVEGGNEYRGRSSSSAEEKPAARERSPLPVFVFVHGGGWSRGGRDNALYGAPSVCRNVAKRLFGGSIAVSIGYRLGSFPGFLDDVTSAVRWVHDNLRNIGGDPSRVYFSGHSAGSHIVSLLMLRHQDFLGAAGVPEDFFAGVALLSGVYDLFCPMKKTPLDVKNKVFVAGYVVPAFGYDKALRRDASPLLLLRPDKDVSLLGALPLALLKGASKWLPGVALPGGGGGGEGGAGSEEGDCGDDDNSVRGGDILDPPAQAWGEAEAKRGGGEASHPHHRLRGPVRTDLPPTIVLNAWFDMGLEENGKLLVDALVEGHGVDAVHGTIPATEHASICYSSRTAETVSEFFESRHGSGQHQQQRHRQRQGTVAQN